MTFPVALLVTGMVLLVFGLIGRITVYEIQAGTDSSAVRWFVSFMGVACIAGGIAREGVFSTNVPAAILRDTPSKAIIEIVQTPRESPPPPDGQPQPSKEIHSPSTEPPDSPKKSLPPSADLPQSPGRETKAEPPPILPAQSKTFSNADDQYVVLAVIEDNDGYTNVRSQPSTEGQIVTTVTTGEVFYTYVQKSPWWHIRTKQGKYGYMHSSRVRVIRQP